MKYSLLFVFSFFILTYCKEKTPVADKTADNAAVAPEGDGLKKHLIAAENWGPQFSSLGVFLKFSDTQYTIDVQGPGGRKCSGAYSTAGQAVQLEAGKDEFGETSDQCIKQSCRIVPTPNSLYATEALGCGNQMYYNTSKRQPKDKAVKIDGHDAVLLDGASANTTDAVVFRAGPSKTSGAIKCTSADGKNRIEYFNLVARTRDKFQVDKWNNYWYYVYAQETDMSGCDKSYGWLFGEFVKP